MNATAMANQRKGPPLAAQATLEAFVVNARSVFSRLSLRKSGPVENELQHRAG
jgi:hypothetical protein